MNTTTNESKSDILHTQTNADEELINNKVSSQTVTNERIGDSALRIIGNNEGFTIVLGPYRVTPVYHTREKAEEAIENKSWEMILNIVGVMIELQRQNEKE